MARHELGAEVVLARLLVGEDAAAARRGERVNLAVELLPAVESRAYPIRTSVRIAGEGVRSSDGSIGAFMPVIGELLVTSP
ncbi:hypothetical protein [Streptomyces sp. NPDC057284]|uniref:hypothetical protein n=1 Tax=Streptomyces sp. NPDC057284 TaxID=3346083 RepID=UPI003643C00C